MAIKRHWLPAIGLGVLALIWGYNWVVMKSALRYAGPFTFAAIRAVLGGAILFALIPILRRPLSPGSLPGIILLGLLQTTGFFGLSIWALVSGGAGKTAVLVYTMPFWIVVMAQLVLGERLRELQWLAVGFAFIGVVFLFHPWGTPANLCSMVIATMAGFSWACAGVWSKFLRGRISVDLMAINAWQLVIGAIPLIGIAVWREQQAIQWTPYFVFAIFYNAFLGTALAWTLWFFALQELSASMAGMGTLATPIVGVITAWLQLAEIPSLWETVGMVFIFCGLAVLSQVKRGVG